MIFTFEVRYRDLDPFGHVNNAVYLTYFEQARLRLFYGLFQKETDFEFVVAAAHVDYLKPLFLETITVKIWVSEIGNTSFRLEYEIYNAQQTLCTRGYSVQVKIEAKTGQKSRIEGAIKRHLQQLQEADAE
jgi:acyl-CoA thioester hydrolase